MADKNSRNSARQNISEMRKITKNVSKLNGKIHSKNGTSGTSRPKSKP